MNSINNNTCEKCKREIPQDAPDGMCPHCLLKQSLDQLGADTGKIELPSIEEVSKWFPQLQILKLLGHGGMGVVYQARQVELERDVAIKMISLSSRKDPELTERFMREAKALAKLNHSNIVSIYDFGEIEEHCYFVMEHVKGSDLQDRINLGDLTLEQTLLIARELCGALEYAHINGIIHRDIKPSNILIDANNKAKIADFGLAKIVHPDPIAQDLTMTDQSMGTLYYMAPEQQTSPQNIDHRVDIYAMGVLIYEMLTGELPIGNFDPPSVKSGCSRVLDDIILKALNPDPDKRYQDASSMKHALEEIKPSSSGAPGKLIIASLACIGLLASSIIIRNIPRKPSIPLDAKEFEGSFYALYLDNIDWHSAVKKCRRMGGHLAVISTKEEADFVAELSRNHVWIGASDEINEGEWIWIDGKKMEFSLWEDGEPNNAGQSENYLMISKYGLWNDFPVYSDRIEGYICEWECDKIVGPITKRKDLNKALKIFNPEYNNKATCAFVNGKVEEIGLVSTGIQTILPLKGLQLKTLNLSLTDVSDISPLKGMPLEHLDISNTKVTDLTPLKDMQLQELHMNCLAVEDISTLKGMPLKKLGMLDTKVTSIAPLLECTTLESIDLPETIEDFDLLKSLPNIKTINNNSVTNQP